MPINADPSKKKPEEMTEEEREAEEEARQAAEQEANEKLNAAISAHLKRAMKGLSPEAISKLVGEQVAKALEGFKPPASEEPKKGEEKNKADPQVLALQEDLEKVKRALQESDAKAKAAEDRERKNGARDQLKTALDAKGIKGARAAALISHMEATEALRFDEDGKPILVVSRSRTKGSPAEALEFEVGPGIDDWAKTTEAAEFLPPPTANGSGRNGAGARGAQPQTGARRQAPRFEGDAVSDAEAARRTHEQLTAQGINVGALLND
jgi:hypothetical protein